MCAAFPYAYHLFKKILCSIKEETEFGKSAGEKSYLKLSTSTFFTVKELEVYCRHKSRFKEHSSWTYRYAYSKQMNNWLEKIMLCENLRNILLRLCKLKIVKIFYRCIHIKKTHWSLLNFFLQPLNIAFSPIYLYFLYILKINHIYCCLGFYVIKTFLCAIWSNSA